MKHGEFSRAARIAGCASQHISGIYHGKHGVSEEMAYKLSYAMGIPVEYFKLPKKYSLKSLLQLIFPWY